MNLCPASQPPAGLSPRVAEVVQALIEARSTTFGGGPITLDEVAVYDVCINGRPDEERTTRALHEAVEAGMADHAGPYWYATRAAYRLRWELEAWFYGDAAAAAPLAAGPELGERCDYAA